MESRAKGCSCLESRGKRWYFFQREKVPKTRFSDRSAIRGGESFGFAMASVCTNWKFAPEFLPAMPLQALQSLALSPPLTAKSVRLYKPPTAVFRKRNTRGVDRRRRDGGRDSASPSRRMDVPFFQSKKGTKNAFSDRCAIRSRRIPWIRHGAFLYILSVCTGLLVCSALQALHGFALSIYFTAKFVHTL